MPDMVLTLEYLPKRIITLESSDVEFICKKLEGHSMRYCNHNQTKRKHYFYFLNRWITKRTPYAINTGVAM